MKKRIFALSFILILIFVFAGCSQQESGAKAQMIVYNNSQYAICGEGESSVIKDCGLPEEINESMAGNRLEYVEETKGGFVISDRQTDMELCEYAPHPNSNVFILKTTDGCYTAIKYDASGYHGIEEE